MTSKYHTPADIGSFFRTIVDISEFLSFVCYELSELVNKNKDTQDWISPVVYSQQGRVFNIDYNFLIKCLSKWLNDDAIESDFMFTEIANNDVVRNGLLLVVGYFEMYYDLVRVRQKTIDVTKFKTAKVFKITDKFYNLLVIKCGDNTKRFSAVPFSASRVKELISAEDYASMMNISDNDEYEQIAFGVVQYSALIKENTGKIDFVFE